MNVVFGSFQELQHPLTLGIHVLLGPTLMRPSVAVAQEWTPLLLFHMPHEAALALYLATRQFVFTPFIGIAPRAKFYTYRRTG